jgi:hypothetical protein
LGEANAILTTHSTWLGLGGMDRNRQAAYRELFKQPLDELHIHALR